MKLTIISTLVIAGLLLSNLSGCGESPNKSHNLSSDSSNTKTDTLQKEQIDILSSNPLIEKKIIDTIFTLKEVMERAKYVEQQTEGKRHLKVWVEDTPHLPDQNYYWIKVGEDNGDALVTHFDFYVYPDSIKIMYYEPSSDSVFTLEKWRKIKIM